MSSWWADPCHQWMAHREQESADSEAVKRLGRGDLVYAMSGGKDSGAVALYLREIGFEQAHLEAGGRVVRYFQDTGWELPLTYAYLATLAKQFGIIHHCALWVPGPGEKPPQVSGEYVRSMGIDQTFWVPFWKTPGMQMEVKPWNLVREFETELGHYSAFLRLIAYKASFVPTQQRWCSRTMKTDVAAAFLATLDDPWTVAGIRAEESAPRAKIAPWGWSDHHDAWAYAPIKWWTAQQVRDIHRLHGFAPNPIYLEGTGAARCGCGPCIFSGRDDLRWLMAEWPKRLDLLARFERAVAQLPQAERHYKRGASAPTWFTMTDRKTRQEVGRPLAEVLEWANAERGGRQSQLFLDAGKKPGCVPWGMCEIPKGDG